MYRIILLFIGCGLAVLLSTAHAELGCDDCAQTLTPRLWIPDGDPALDQLPLKSSHAEVRINGPIAQVTVTQHYRNAGTRPINARYVFPGSTRAAVHGLTIKIGERVIKAKIKEKQQAKQDFETAKAQGKRASLLEQQRPNVFMMETANLMPGDDIELELIYSELLVPEQGIYQFVYPTVVGPRYGSDPFQVATDAAWLANPYAANSQDGSNPAATQTSIKVTLDSPIAVKDLISTQHKIQTDWRDAKSAQITLASSETEAGNRDFILKFRLQGNQIMSGLMTYSQGDENFFLAMVQPPQRVNAEQIMRREYIFVLDVSGSMHGFPLDTAKTLMRRLLSDLKPHETFNILFFSGGSEVFSPTPVPASPANIQNALASLNNYAGGGGTELVNALQTAYAMPRNQETARSVVVATDGYVNAERDAYDLIGKNLNASNLFAFGIGSSVNRYLIESMAQAGAGESFVVTQQNQVADVSARFRRYVESPLLSNIRLQGDGVELYDMEPVEIPLLLAERPIVVFGKYRTESDSAGLVLSGTAASDIYTVALPLREAQHDNRAELLPVLWARHRLMRLSDWAGNEVELHRTAIVDLALKYSLLSRYTSFIAVDEVIANPDSQAKNVQQALPLPQGVEVSALASTPMPEPELAILILLLLACYGYERWLKDQADA
ncbi:MAG: VWA domain-containing protein [Methylomonas sp.]|jgi:Ca-activated chloride channel family protein|uniref:VIT domain-containing protein n=1 Tax=Methylomonas sp. TaxID=418 RepID=UPI0025F6CE4F|nr:VIT domain-containing protein [Methylomonas sp.]MCK9608405.1 VWA domain-containing protein [Methylomonas sp.]